MKKKLFPLLAAVIVVGGTVALAVAVSGGDGDDDTVESGAADGSGSDAVDSGPADGGLGDGGTGDDFSTEEARDRARGLLGMWEDELPADDDIRVGRRGSEEMMLTEDYRLGRRTVALEEEGGRFRVVEVTVELPDGPETFHLEGG